MRDTVKLNTYINNYKGSLDLLSKINGYMVAFIASGSFISIVFNRLGIVENGLYPKIVIFSFSVSIISTFILSKFRAFQINKRSLFVVSSILMWFLVTYLRYDNYIYLNEYLVDFLFYGVVIFLMISIPFSYEKVIAGTSMLSLLVLLNPVVVLNEFITDTKIGGSHIEMGLSYGLLPIVSAGILHMIFFRKEANFLVKISYILNLVFFVLLLFFSIRGVLIALVVLIYAIIFTLKKEKFKIIVNALVYPSIVFLIMVLFYINDLLLYTYNFLLNKGIEITAITKSVHNMGGSTGLSSGRGRIYENALQLFLEKPFIGNGISYYAYYSGGGYPHNLILQLLLETGFILTIPILIIIFSGIKISFSSINKFQGNKNYKIFILFCLVSSLPRLMFSGYLWEEPMFWLFLFSVLGTGAINYDMFRKNVKT